MPPKSPKGDFCGLQSVELCSISRVQSSPLGEVPTGDRGIVEKMG